MNNESLLHQLPGEWSTVAARIDWVYYFIYWTSVVLFIGITGAALYFTWKYRKRPGHKSVPTGHNVPLEVAWTIAPIFLLALLFHWGFAGYVDLTVAPANAMDIRVRARKWSWDFEYPNGAHSVNELHVPVGRPVRLVLSSEDVIHSFYVPGFRVKRDAVPNYFQMLWFQATHLGHTHFFCAEYCGASGNTPARDAQGHDQYTGHFSMGGEVYIETEENFVAYMDRINKCYLADGHTECSPQEWGSRLYRQSQCFTCHSTDGSRITGPSWRGIWGRDEHFVDGGNHVVDETYVRESILNPSAHVVQGYQNVMPTFRGSLNDRQIDALIAYIRSLR